MAERAAKSLMIQFKSSVGLGSSNSAGDGHTDHRVVAGPASYGLTDSMGRMHGDAQFAGSSSVPAHVEMMGLIGAGNNPMVGMTVACAVAASQANA